MSRRPAASRGSSSPTTRSARRRPARCGDGGTWPAEGQGLWAHAGIPTTNYITGPTYLLNWGIPTVDKLDVRRMRAEAIAFTELLLELSRVPRARLRRLDLR